MNVCGQHFIVQNIYTYYHCEEKNICNLCNNNKKLIIKHYLFNILYHTYHLVITLPKLLHNATPYIICYRLYNDFW